MRHLSDTDKQRLIQAAFAAKDRAYSPHSNFPVGAALLSATGYIILGASIDNTAQAANTCAEQTAIVKAVSEGIRSFEGLAVVGPNTSPIAPCGICLQVMREFCDVDLPILLVPNNEDLRDPPTRGDYARHGVKERSLKLLLPGI